MSGNEGAQAGRLALATAGAVFGGPLGGLAGALLGGLLFPAQEKHGPQKIATLKVSAPQKGQVLPVLWGTRKLPGHYIWRGDFHTIPPSTGKKGGKGGKGSTTQATTYTVGLALAICEGTDDPVNRPIFLLKIYAGKDVIWDVNGTVGTGLDFVFYDGRPGQLPDPYMAQFTSGAAAVTGVTTGLGPLLTEQFDVDGGDPNALPPVFVTKTLSQPPVGAGTDSVYVTYHDVNTGLEVRFYLTATTATSPSEGEYTINLATGLITFGPPPAVIFGTNTYDGVWHHQIVTVQYQHAIGQTVVAIGALAYPHCCYIVFPSFHLGNTTAPPNLQFEIGICMPVNNISLSGMDASFTIAVTQPDGLSVLTRRPTAPGGTQFSVGGFLTASGAILAMEVNNAQGGTPDRVMISTDGGVTWSQFGSNVPSIDGLTDNATFVVQTPSGVVVVQGNPLGGPVGIVTQEAYIWRSTDQGATWQKVDVTTAPARDTIGVNVLTMTPSGTILASTTHVFNAVAPAETKVWRSTDGGLTWVNVLTPSIVSANGAYSNSIQSIDGLVFYRETETELTGPTRVWRSADDGQTWTQVFQANYNSDFTSQAEHNSFIGKCSDGSYVMFTGDFWLNPSPPEPIHRWRSRDGGQTWTDEGVTLSGSYATGAIWSTGQALFMWQNYATDSPSPSVRHLTRSLDNGVTWTDMGITADGSDWGLFPTWTIASSPSPTPTPTPNPPPRPAPPPPPVPPGNPPCVTINPASASLVTGQSIQISATLANPPCT